MSAPYDVYSSDNLIVRFRPSKNNVGPIVITFDSYADHRTLSRAGFGEQFLCDHNICALHVIGRENDWYQFPDLPLALATIRSLTAGRKAFTYGSSMGGYAAIRFGGLCNASTAISFSPQYSIDPDVCGFDNRWQQEAQRIDFCIEKTQLETFVETSYVFFDPWNPDRDHVKLYAGHTKLVELPMAGSGHPAISFLADTGLLSSTILGIIYDQFDAAQFIQNAKSRRRLSPTYFRVMCERSRSLTRQITLARMALALQPNNSVSISNLGLILSRNGHFDEALALHKAALQAHQNNWIYLHRLSEHYEMCGELELAIEAAKTVAELQVGMPQYRDRLNFLIEVHQQAQNQNNHLQLGAVPVEIPSSAKPKFAKRLASVFFRHKD